MHCAIQGPRDPHLSLRAADLRSREISLHHESIPKAPAEGAIGKKNSAPVACMTLMVAYLDGISTPGFRLCGIATVDRKNRMLAL